MAPQSSNLRSSAGLLRLAMLLLGIIGLAFIIAAVCIHDTDDFVGYEAVTYDAIGITTVRLPPARQPVRPKI